MNPKEFAASLLAQGIPPVQVAKTVGVSDSMISQWNSEEEFQQLVASQLSEITQDQIKFDDDLDDAEEIALRNIKQRLPLANLQQSMAAFRILNTAKRRKQNSGYQPGQGIAAPIVNITLPTAVMPQYIRNAQSEIVEVDGKVMLSASPQQLSLLAQQKLGRAIVPADQLKLKNERAEDILNSVIAPSAKKQRVTFSSKEDIVDQL